MLSGVIPKEIGLFQEPWSDIGEYPSSHANALTRELKSELALGHPLFGKALDLLAKREDSDDILVSINRDYFIVHLTWSGARKPSIPNF